jgi:hypothetical protein
MKITQNNLTSIVLKILSKIDPSFKKEGNILISRPSEDIWKLLEIKKYTFKFDNKEIYTVDLAIFLPKIYKKAMINLPKRIVVSDGIISFNIYESTNGFNGKKINQHFFIDDMEILKIEISKALEQSSLFFQSINSLVDVKSFFD